MPELAQPWNSLEIAKIIVGILTPLSVVIFGWLLSRSSWSNQKLIEKRLALYDELSPRLNALLCFYTWVGYWKDISPKDVIDTKRSLDKAVNIYRHLLGEAFYAQYQAFIALLFVPYFGPGHDAKIRSRIHSADGDRRKHCSYRWKTNWQSSFAESDVAPKVEVKKSYALLMKEFKDSVGIRS